MAGETGSIISLSTVASIVLGAAISAAVSYFLQRNSFKETRKQKELDKREAQKVLGYSLYFKMGKIASNLNTLRKSHNESLAVAKKNGAEGDPWRFVQPLSYYDADIHFSAEEMGLILSLNPELFNEMMPWDAIFNSEIELFRMYGRKRQALMEPLSAEMTGSVGKVSFSADQMGRLAPKMAELNDLIVHMKKAVDSDSKKSWEVVKWLFSVLVKEFDLKLSLQKKPD
jgi:hypothetical protein